LRENSGVKIGGKKYGETLEKNHQIKKEKKKDCC